MADKGGVYPRRERGAPSQGAERPAAGTAAREPVYVISVAAKMVEMHPQTLRLYERLGLLTPARSGSNRLYSADDIERLRQIQRLTQEMGVNLAGVEVILSLLEKIDALQAELEQMRQQRLPVPVQEIRGSRR